MGSYAWFQYPSVVLGEDGEPRCSWCRQEIEICRTKGCPGKDPEKAAEDLEKAKEEARKLLAERNDG